MFVFDYLVFFLVAKLLQPAPISLKPSLRLHFDNIWASTYGTFCKVANSDDVYVFGLNNYNQLGKCSDKNVYLIVFLNFIVLVFKLLRSFIFYRVFKECLSQRAFFS